eukprot:365196-Chlamydomonas_euryale.AAC.9
MEKSSMRRTSSAWASVTCMHKHGDLLDATHKQSQGRLCHVVRRAALPYQVQSDCPCSSGGRISSTLGPLL